MLVGSLAHVGSIAQLSNCEVFDSRVVKVPDSIKCISLNNQQCQPRPTLISLNPDELHSVLSICC